MSKQQDHYLLSEYEQLNMCDAKHQKLKYVSSFLKLFKLIKRYDLEKMFMKTYLVSFPYL